MFFPFHCPASCGFKHKNFVNGSLEGNTYLGNRQLRFGNRATVAKSKTKELRSYPSLLVHSLFLLLLLGLPSSSPSLWYPVETADGISFGLIHCHMWVNAQERRCSWFWSPWSWTVTANNIEQPRWKNPNQKWNVKFCRFLSQESLRFSRSTLSLLGGFSYLQHMEAKYEESFAPHNLLLVKKKGKKEKRI